MSGKNVGDLLNAKWNYLGMVPRRLQTFVGGRRSAVCAIKTYQHCGRFSDRLHSAPRELEERSPHERREFLRGDLEVGLPCEFFDRDPIDVAQVHSNRNPSPRP
jgi:hypothetical protein